MFETINKEISVIQKDIIKKVGLTEAQLTELQKLCLKYETLIKEKIMNEAIPTKDPIFTKSFNLNFNKFFVYLCMYLLIVVIAGYSKQNFMLLIHLLGWS